ncbi:uncharacterized protein LOC107852778 [Capsicum annuum]|uniref:uncharacterized protein LOC107852778 n=1 Tax=Capsicum annuum TaxID=4072 RepID=UPI0007BF41D9|nr:uncharacterized protein LOC107852778 [Capsicum annuum]
MAKLRNLSINIPLLEAIQEIPRYAKLIKNLISKKKLIEEDTIEVTHGCNAMIDNKVAEKKDDHGAFTIPFTIWMHEFEKSLCDLGASIKLIYFVIYKKLGLDTPTPTSMRFLMSDQSIKRPVGILFDVLVKVDKFFLPADFVVLDCEIDHEVPIILGHPFSATERTIVDLELGEIKFRVQENKVSFKTCKSKNQTSELQVVSMVDVENKKVIEEGSKDLL